MSLKRDEDYKFHLPSDKSEDGGHFHCPKCNGKEYIVINTGVYCKECHPEKLVMVFCTPPICGSS